MSKTEWQQVALPPLPGILDALQSTSWSTTEALAELVDNSFGAERGDSRRVDITWDASQRELVVLDDGLGMTEPLDLLRLGAGAGQAGSDIGKFGWGGSRAMLWLADNVEVQTLLRDGRWGRARVDWLTRKKLPGFDGFETTGMRTDAVADVSDGLRALGHGTLLRLHVKPARRVRPAEIVRKLVELYAPALRAGRVLTWQGHAVTTPALPVGAERLAVDIVWQGQRLAAEGAVWVDEEAPASRWGIDVAYGHRVILPAQKEAFIRPDRRSPYVGAGVCGYVALAPEWKAYLTDTKNDINDDYLKEALFGVLSGQLAPLLQQRERATRKIALHGLRDRGQAVIAALFESALGWQGTGRERRPDVLKPVGPYRGNGNPPRDDIEPRREKTRSGGKSTARGVPLYDLMLVPWAQMEGTPCRVYLMSPSGRIQTHVAAEHPAIRELDEGRPLALRLLVSSTAANALAHLDAASLRYFLSGKLARQLMGESETARFGLLMGRFSPVESASIAAAPVADTATLA